MSDIQLISHLWKYSHSVKIQLQTIGVEFLASYMSMGVSADNTAL